MTAPYVVHWIWSALRKAPWWAVLAWLVPTTLSLVSLCVTFYDRRPRLTLQRRKGDDWYFLRPLNTVRGHEVQFARAIEIYNSSGRSNAIKAYEFFYKDSEGQWKPMESRRYEDRRPDGTGPLTHNDTPMTVAPYSGEVWPVMAFIVGMMSLPPSLEVRIVVEDIFGHQREVTVTAYK